MKREDKPFEAHVFSLSKESSDLKYYIEIAFYVDDNSREHIISLFNQSSGKPKARYLTSEELSSMNVDIGWTSGLSGYMVKNKMFYHFFCYNKGSGSAPDEYYYTAVKVCNSFHALD